MSAKRGWVATAIGLFVVALYIAAGGGLDSTGQFVNDGRAVGYGLAAFVAAAGGSWPILSFGGNGNRTR